MVSSAIFVHLSLEYTFMERMLTSYIYRLKLHSNLGDSMQPIRITRTFDINVLDILVQNFNDLLSSFFMVMIPWIMSLLL